MKHNQNYTFEKPKNLVGLAEGIIGFLIHRLQVPTRSRMPLRRYVGVAQPRMRPEASIFAITYLWLFV